MRHPRFDVLGALLLADHPREPDPSLRSVLEHLRIRVAPGEQGLIDELINRVMTEMRTLTRTDPSW